MTTEPKLPPTFPEPDITSYQFDSAGRKYMLRTYGRRVVGEYGDARAAHAVAQMQGKLVGVADTMPGTTGFTMAVFYADQVPLGTPLYTAAPATAEQPQAREITDAEIDALLLQEIGFEPEELQSVNRGDLHSIVRAAIALANGRGDS